MSDRFQFIPTGESIPDGAVMEVVAYTVKEEALDGFGEIQQDILDYVSKMRGYISSIQLNQVEDKNTFVKLALWDSLDNARAASRAFEAWPKFGSVMEKISEMKMMAHLTTV